ncbi:MAG: hypothetical protein E7039_08595 [Lentisphaerae bacterium]|nr:hypothetical protein [Lentisphaerota bacterium]
MEPILKIGIVSDSQGYDVMEDWGMSNMEKALKMLAPYKPDIIISGGDIADLGAYHGAITLYKELCKKYFPYDPVQIACAGNHDLWLADRNANREIPFKSFCEKMGISTENPYHTVINNYDFITVSEDINCNYTPELVEKLAVKLEIAAKRNSGKPIFVLSHFPPKDTMSGSDHAGKTSLRELFNKYPQVISISGHTHYPLEDERCIWQGEFTAFTTSTLSYGCMAEDLFNVCNSIVPFAREAVQALYMEVFADHIEIHRYNVEDFCEIKPDMVWSFALPYDPANPEYSITRRAEKRNAPVFPENASLVLRYDYGFVYAVFDVAKHEDMVQYYCVEAARKDAAGVYQTTGSAKFVSDFYRLNSNKAKRMFFKLPEDLLIPGEIHKISVYAIESFGRKSEPLVIERVIPPDWRFKAIDPQCMPQE